MSEEYNADVSEEHYADVSKEHTTFIIRAEVLQHPKAGYHKQ
jgi:hypothetical protein